MNNGARNRMEAVKKGRIQRSKGIYGKQNQQSFLIVCILDIKERKESVLCSIIGLGTRWMVMLFSEIGQLGMRSVADCVDFLPKSHSSFPPC